MSDPPSADAPGLSPTGPRAAVPPMAWWWRSLLFSLLLVGTFLAVMVGVGLVAAVLVSVGAPGAEAFAARPEFLFAMELALAAALVGLAALFWTTIDRRRWTALGLRWPAPREWAAALLLAALPVAVSFVIGFTSGHLRFEGLAAPDAAALLYHAGLYAGLCLLIGIAEETPFRGYLLPNLAEGMGRFWGVLASSVFFALLHAVDPINLRPLNVLVLTLTGVGLAWLRLATGSLALPVAVHALYDYLLFVSGADPDFQHVFRMQVGPENLWLGGVKVAGLVDVLVSLAWLLLIWKWIYLPARNPIPEAAAGVP